VRAIPSEREKDIDYCFIFMEARFSIIDERSKAGFSLVVDGGIAFRVNFLQ
jgi:hypothetical protein